MNSETGETVRWITLVVGVAAVLMTLCITIYQSNKFEDEIEAKLYSQAMEHNINPMLVDCAFNSKRSDETFCLALSFNQDLDEVRNKMSNEEINK